MAGVNRRHLNNITTFSKNFKILEFGDDIQNQHEKCIEISTNMSSIGLEIPEIALEISEFSEKSTRFCMRQN